MKFKIKDVVIGFVVIASVVGFSLLYRNLKTPKVLSTPVPSTVKEDLGRDFNYEIPDDVDSVELKSVSDKDYKAIATRDYKDGNFEHIILADLPDPENGYFYEGWLVDGEKHISTGKMRLAKGGYLLEFNSGSDYSSYGEVVVTLEKVDDKKPEEHVLEGEF